MMFKFQELNTDPNMYCRTNIENQQDRMIGQWITYNISPSRGNIPSQLQTFFFNSVKSETMHISAK